MSDGAGAGKTTGGRVTRRQLLTGAGAAAIGGLAIGGIGGYALGSSGDDEASGDGATTTGGGGSTETIKLGSASPTTGAYSGDGQEMTRGQELAVDEINAAGGVLGRQLELVVFDVEDPFAPEKMVNAARRLTNDGVAATFSGYTTTTSAEFDVYAEYGAPMFHLNTFQPNADYVADNGITNIYHSCPTEVWYGPGFIQFMERLIDAGAWEPSSESAAVVTSNDPYSISIARTVRAGLEELGWDVPVNEQVTAPLTEWGPVLAKIRQNPPGLIFHADYIPGDLASFQQQFRSDPTPSLMYQQYGPSIPEYLELAGADADGVIWSTVIGTLPDQTGQAFRELYSARVRRGGRAQSGRRTVRPRARVGPGGGDGRRSDRVRAGEREPQAHALSRRERHLQLQARGAHGDPVPRPGERSEPRHGPPDVPDPGPGTGVGRPRSLHRGRVPAAGMALGRGAGRVRRAVGS